MIIYRKVKVSERLPKEGWVLTPSGAWMFHGGNFKCPHDGTIQQGIDEWLEVGEWFSDDYIMDEENKQSTNEAAIGFNNGVNYVLNKLNNNESLQKSKNK